MYVCGVTVYDWYVLPSPDLQHLLGLAALTQITAMHLQPATTM